MDSDLPTFYSAISEAAAGIAAIVAAVLIGRLQQQLANVKRLVDDILDRLEELRSALVGKAEAIHDYRTWAASVRHNFQEAPPGGRTIVLNSERWLSGSVDYEVRVHVTPEYVDEFRTREFWIDRIEDGLKKVHAARTPEEIFAATALLKLARAQFTDVRRDRHFLDAPIAASDRISELAHRIDRESEIFWPSLGGAATMILAGVVITAIGRLRPAFRAEVLYLFFVVGIVALGSVLVAELVAVKQAARFTTIVDKNAR